MTSPLGRISRRRFLALAATGLAIGSSGSGYSALGKPATAAALGTPTAAWKGARSANGWPIGGESASYRIEGTNYDISLAVGAVATILLHAVRRFNYEVDSLRAGDAHGLTTDRTVLSAERSNLLSGTAVLIRPDSFPHGTSGNLYPQEVTVLEDIVAEAGGSLAWGGHLATPDQGLLYVTKSPSAAAVPLLAEEYGSMDSMSATGGAGQIDAFDSQRLQRKRELRQ